MLHTLEHVLIHAVEDNIAVIPFLFITYCIMESMEHTVSAKTEGAVKYSGKMGPLFGGILGIIPQCGFSAAYRFSLHFMPRSTLIEVGAQTNTKAEAKNAMKPLAEVLASVLTE